MKAKAIVCAIAIYILMMPLCAQFAGGSGTPEDPYLVASAAQLHSVRTNLSAHYRQIAEINFSGTPYGGGTGWLPIGTEASPFTGSYDGDDYQIWGLNIHRSSGWSGLFGVISHASVKNVQIWGANVICEYQAASLVGFLHYSAMENCSVNASDIEGYDFTGGLVSYAYESSIISCSADISLQGHESVGGIVGLLTRSGIRDCHAQFSFSDTWYQVGGIVGTAEHSSIIDCTFSGDMYSLSWSGGIVGHATNTRVVGCSSGPGLMMSGDMCGGIVGQAYIMVDIINCSSSMDISAHLTVGGIAGVMQNYSTAQNSHASGNVRAMYPVGGFAGGISNSTVSNCYSTGNVFGSISGGGFAGSISNSGSLVQNCYSIGLVSIPDGESGGFSGAGSSTSSLNCYWDMDSSGCSTSVSGEGRNTIQMTSPADPQTYVNWDFETVWNWNNGPAGGYPGLSPLPVDIDDPISPSLPAIAIRAYPNPFTAQATISFELKEQGSCRVSLYDIKGRLITRLADAFLRAGEQRLSLDAHSIGLTSGHYLILLEHKGIRQVKRITLFR